MNLPSRNSPSWFCLLPELYVRCCNSLDCFPCKHKPARKVYRNLLLHIALVLELEYITYLTEVPVKHKVGKVVLGEGVHVFV